MNRRIEKECNTHGMTTHVEAFDLVKGVKYPRWRCTSCRYEAIKRRRQKIKRELVTHLGGKCARCGYDEHIEALEFHHRDPAEKDFQIGGKANIAIAKLFVEVEKCMLLCANCHRIEHYELRQVVP